MDKYYIKVTGRGFLKDITKQWHNGYFTKQHNLACASETKAEAEAMRALAVKKIKKIIKDSEKIINKLTSIADEADWNKTSMTKIKAILKSAKISYWGSNPEWKNIFDRRWGQYGSARSELKAKRKLLPKIEKAKIELEEARILFYPKKKGTAGWMNTEASISSVSERVYCSGCGGVIPGARYLRLTNFRGYVIELCPFCAKKLAETAMIEAEQIDPKLEKQYKSDAFMEML